MKLIIDIDQETIDHAIEFKDLLYDKIITSVGKAIADGKPLKTELEEIKAEIRQGVSDFANENGDIAYGFMCAEKIIDNHIKELNNE